MSISQNAMKIVKATAPVVAENLGPITTTFYPRMFKNNPEVLKYFNPTNQRTGRQPQALAGAVAASVAHLEDLDSIGSALNLMAHKHCALGVQAEDYQIVHDNFLGAVAEVLGDAVTAEVAAAWSEVLMLVATNLIGREQALYAAAAAKPGGWSGIKDFLVTRVVEEAPNVKSLYLEPKDGSSKPEFVAGQYVTVCNNPTDQQYFAPRHYTISHPSELRISPQLMTAAGAPNGLMSSFLHQCREGDVVQLRPPFGEFTRDSIRAQDNVTEVYVTGGIGVTTTAALAGEACAEARRVALFHASDDETHPLCEELQVEQRGAPGSMQVLGDRNVVSSVVPTLKQKNIDIDSCHFFVCGPAPMMQATMAHLQSNGVKDDAIHFEAFGPKPSFN